MPRKMKTKKQIKEEIKLTKNTIDNYRQAYKNKEITKDVFKNQILDCYVTIDTLRWVLGENDRYD